MKKLTIIACIFLLPYMSNNKINAYDANDYKALVTTLKNKQALLISELKTTELLLKVNANDNDAIEKREKLKVQSKEIDECINIINKAMKANDKKNECFKKYQEAKSTSEILDKKVDIINDKMK